MAGQLKNCVLFQGKDERFFSLLHNFQTSSRAHNATYSTDTKYTFLGVKQLGMIFATHVHLMQRLRTSGAIPPLPPYPFVACTVALLIQSNQLILIMKLSINIQVYLYIIVMAINMRKYCFNNHKQLCKKTYIYIYRMSQEERAKLREGVPYVKIYRYNPKHLCPKLNGYGHKGQRKVWSFCSSTYCTWFA